CATVVKATSSVTEMLRIEVCSPRVAGNTKFEYANIVGDNSEKVSSEMERFFPENDED
ncbi:conjugal transfer protein TraM, partial [Escherichia coli]|uniref:relaxosome protein TraM n=1 Tax=Escherichia coli TaxID=562 RepID=UPI0017C11702